MSIQDAILIPVVFVVIMISVYIGWTIIDEVDTAMVGDYPIVESFFDDGKAGLRVFDYMIIFTICSIGIGAIILAASIRTHPAFMPLALIILAIFVVVTSMMSNVWYEIQQAPQFAAVVNEMDNFVRMNSGLPLFVAVLGVMIIIALFTKPWERTAPSF